MTAATTVWQSEVRYFANIRQGPQLRGLLEYTPRKLVREKLIANMARHMLATNDLVPEHLLLFAPGERVNSALLKQLLPEIYHLEICSDVDDDILALFGQPDGSYVNVASCTTSQKFPQNLFDAAKSLNMFVPDLAQATNDFLLQRLQILEKKFERQGATFANALVMQDGGSKFLIPELESQSLRAASRLLKIPSNGKQTVSARTSLEAPIGSGFNALMFDIAKHKPDAGTYRQLAAKRLRLNTQSYSFDNLPLVVFATLQWLEETASLKLDQLKTIKIMAPYAAVGMQIVRLFEQETKLKLSPEQVDLDHFIFGWQKSLPLVELIGGDQEGPAFLLYIDQFPLVDLTLAW